MRTFELARPDDAVLEISPKVRRADRHADVLNCVWNRFSFYLVIEKKTGLGAVVGHEKYLESLAIFKRPYYTRYVGVPNSIFFGLATLLNEESGIVGGVPTPNFT